MRRRGQGNGENPPDLPKVSRLDTEHDGPRTASISDITKLVERRTRQKVEIEIASRQEAERYHKQGMKSAGREVLGR